MSGSRPAFVTEESKSNSGDGRSCGLAASHFIDRAKK